jgi:hypothetical protein
VGMRISFFSQKKVSFSLLTVFLSVLSLIFQPLNLYSQERSFAQTKINQFSAIALTFNKHDAFSFVKELTQDKYSGRNSGTEGCDMAANWIAGQFKSWGLKPYQGDSYFQPVSSPLVLMKTNNVIGFFPSIDKTSQASIVIGAHYDHLGKDRSGNIFRGANDNASGSGVMLEIAHALSSSILLNQINIVFIAFSGEEKGLLGSYQYVNQPLFPLDKTVVMINLDMVGTGIGPWEVASNFENKPSLKNLLQDVFTYYKIPFRLASWYLKPVSDHYPFYAKGVPVVFFFRSNPSRIGGYHTIKDTIDTIDITNLDECGKLSLVIALLAGKELIHIEPRYKLNGNGNSLYNMILLGSEINGLKSSIVTRQN